MAHGVPIVRRTAPLLAHSARCLPGHQGTGGLRLRSSGKGIEPRIEPFSVRGYHALPTRADTCRRTAPPSITASAVYRPRAISDPRSEYKFRPESRFTQRLSRSAALFLRPTPRRTFQPPSIPGTGIGKGPLPQSPHPAVTEFLCRASRDTRTIAAVPAIRDQHKVILLPCFKKYLSVP